jgi:predicted PP-loop superfamily ATPase
VASIAAVRELRDPDCCRVTSDRVASDYQIASRSVLFGEQAKFVEIRAKDLETDMFYFRTDVCGRHEAADQEA